MFARFLLCSMISFIVCFTVYLLAFRTPPVTFESKFMDAYPALYRRLQNAAPGEKQPSYTPKYN